MKELNITFNLDHTPVFPVAGNVYGLTLIGKPQKGTVIKNDNINEVNLNLFPRKGSVYANAVNSRLELSNFNAKLNKNVSYENKGYRITKLELTSKIPLPEKAFWLNLFRDKDMFTCNVCLFRTDDYLTYRLSDENISDFNSAIKEDDYKSWMLLSVLDCGIQAVDVKFEVEYFEK